MFYRPFAKFWKKKTLVRYPLVVYAPQFGSVLLFLWWFISTSATSKSLDSTIFFLFNDVFGETLKQLFYSFNNNNNSNSVQARNTILDFCGRIYGVVIPYCLVLLSVISINQLVPSVEAMSDAAQALLNHWTFKLFLHGIAAVVLSWNGVLTPDVVVALIIGILFTVWRGMSDGARQEHHNDES